VPAAKDISTDAKAGKILIFIGVILNIISFPILFVLGTALVLVSFGALSGFQQFMIFGLDFYTMGLIYIILGIISVIGLILKIMAYRQASQKENFHNAGVYGIVASFIPPLDVVTLIGGILCWVSKEAGRRKR